VCYPNGQHCRRLAVEPETTMEPSLENRNFRFRDFPLKIPVFILHPVLSASSISDTQFLYCASWTSGSTQYFSAVPAWC
jgi:hypothetical protein